MDNTERQGMVFIWALHGLEQRNKGEIEAEKHSEKCQGKEKGKQAWVELWDLKQVMSEEAAMKPVKTDKSG